MLKTLTEEDEADRGAWLPAFWKGKLDGQGGSEVTGWGPPRPLTVVVFHRLPKAVPSPTVLSVQHLLASPGSEHHSEQEPREANTAR